MYYLANSLGDYSTRLTPYGGGKHVRYSHNSYKAHRLHGHALLRYLKHLTLLNNLVLKNLYPAGGRT